jgi:esterase
MRCKPSVDLAHTRVGETAPPLLVLHGLFGAGSNWRTIARGLEDCRSVYLLDARNHGRSPHTATTDYAAMAADVEAFMDVHAIESADILGHSMGGKTAMHLALHRPHRVSRLIVVDIAPAPSPSDHLALIDTLLALPIEQFTRRADVDQHLAQSEADAGLRAFLLQNLSTTADGFKWRINLAALRDCMPALLAFDCEPAVVFNGPTTFIRGARSPYVSDEHHADIHALFPRSTIHTVAGAGHWVHAEQAALFVQATRSFLQCPDATRHD